MGVNVFWIFQLLALSVGFAASLSSTEVGRREQEVSD